MAFKPVMDEEGDVLLLPATNSVAFTKGDALIFTSGLLALAASSTAVDIRYIAAQTVTTTSSGQLIAVIPTKGIRFQADCDLAPTQAESGTVVDLASASTLDPDAVTNQLFFIDEIDLSKGAVGTTTVVFGHFVEGVPNS